MTIFKMAAFVVFLLYAVIITLLQVIVSMIIPFSSENTVFRSYKIMPRAQVSDTAVANVVSSCGM